MSQISDQIRKTFHEADMLRDDGLKTPEGIMRFDNILYGSDPKWNIMDIYCPKNNEGKKFPVIVSVHGGGWVYGDKEVYQFYCMSLARRGFAVVNFTYRLAPEFKFPAALEDLSQVLNWIKLHAAEYQINKEQIFAVGDSAGAHQLALYTEIMTNKAYAENFDIDVPEGIRFKGIALNCGHYRTISDPADTQTPLLMADYLPNGGTQEELEMIDVTEHVTEKFPPVFLMTASGDFLKNQAVLMSEALSDKEVPFIYRFYGNHSRQLGHVFHCNIKLKDADICNDEECSFFKSLLYTYENNMAED